MEVLYIFFFCLSFFCKGAWKSQTFTFSKSCWILTHHYTKSQIKLLSSCFPLPVPYNYLTWRGPFPCLFVFSWWLSRLSQKHLADSSGLFCNLLLALSSLKLFVPPYNPTTFPRYDFLESVWTENLLRNKWTGGGEHGRVVILGAKPNHEPKKTNKQIKKMKP